MKVTYKNVKLYQRSYEKLDQVRVSLRKFGVFLNKAQTLSYAIEHLKSGLEKFNQGNDGSN